MDDTRAKVEKIVREVVSEWLADRAGQARLEPLSDPRSRPLVAANWKMNLLQSDAGAFARRLRMVEGADLVICPPAILLPVLREALGSLGEVALGAQTIHHEPSGAFTGEHSAAMIRDSGASYAIVGHSERRTIFKESDDDVAKKLEAALGASLVPILCVGEHMEERRDGSTFRVLRSQLFGSLGALPSPLPDPADLVIAYEPVWAIGTGLTATPHQAGEAMEFIRDVLAERLGWSFARRVRLLYGGSVTEVNAGSLAQQPDIDGFLVGGASLCADKLGSIARLAVASRPANRESRGSP